LRRALAAAAAMCLAAAAPVAAKQSVSASPNPVHVGETLVIKGKGWPVIEFCSRTVRLDGSPVPTRASVAVRIRA
jgi:hypothetical protein